MGFREQYIKHEYRNQENDVVAEFYIPLLRESILYRRAVGFFSSTALVQYSKGIASLIENGGKMEMVASPHLSEEDINAIKLGYEERDKIIKENIVSSLNEPANYFEEERLNLMAHYIAEYKMEIKIAMLESNNRIGMYHEKLGLMYDRESNIVAFTGSMNESNNALNVNYEAIDVFCSWDDPQNRVNDKVNAFEKIWKNEEKNITIVPFPELNEEILRRYQRKAPNIYIDQEEFGEEKIEEGILKSKKEYIPRIPNGVELHDYQKEAIRKWEENGFRGIFDMATGTGKTFTGLGGLVRLCEVVNNNLAVVIVCPYQHLVEQWVEDMRLFGIDPIVGHGGSTQKDYKKRLKNATIDYKLGVKKFFCFICTNATYLNGEIQKSLDFIRGNSLLIVDEAHNFGATSLSKTFSRSYTYRLALSATLNRHNDIEGTNKIRDYFGETCIEYTLEQAIQNGFLTPYYYHPVVVTLTDDEFTDYMHLSQQIGACIINSRGGGSKLSLKGKKLALERSKIVAGAFQKTEKLKEIIYEYKDDTHLLVYCGATNVAAEEYDEKCKRQIDRICEVLGKELGMSVSQFTANEDMNERRIIKHKFEVGNDLQALVAIKCLDEGVNIPKIKTAFILASTTNPKEYIQRRGRVLRKAKGKKHAVIYDFVTLPRTIEDATSQTEDILCYDLPLVKNEIRRMEEFSNAALNPMEGYQLIEKLKDIYDLWNMSDEEEE